MKNTILLTVAVLLAVPPLAPAAILLVPSQYATVQAAIDAAVNGDVVILDPVTFTGDGNRDIDFLGKAITVRSIDPNDPNIVATTIIDCEHAGRGFYLHRGEQTSSVIAGLTIQNGRASRGGGIYCMGVSPRIANCALIGNVAQGGLSAYGGGIYCDGGEPRIINCTIVQNAVIAKNWPSGSGIYCESCAPLISNCIISHNSGRAAGAIQAHRSDPKIISCVINCNDGGIMGSGHSHVTVESSIISGNSGLVSAIYVHSFSSLNIKNSLVMGNSTLTYAMCPGLMFGWESSFTVTNCTIASNISLSGEALAGGICYDGFTSSGSIANSVIWGNWGSQIAQWHPNPQVSIDVNHCNIEGGYLGLGNINVDPCFASNTDYHLMPDSPCINAGDPNFVPEPSETDIDGQPRVIGGRVDMGADEFDPATPIIGISPTVFDFSIPVGVTEPETRTLSIRGSSGATLNWQIINDCPWLDVCPTSGQSSGEVDEVAISVDANGLGLGEYSCVLTVSDPNAINSPQYVTVNLYVRAPVIGVTPTDFSFVCPVSGPNPEPQILWVWNDDIGTLNWQITEECDWLEVSPTSGQSSGQSDEVVITVNPYGLDVGQYSCVLSVSDPNAINSPQYVTINLVIRAPVIGVTPTAFQFVCPLDDPNPQPQTLSIWNNDVGPLNWQIIEDSSWLYAAPISGSSTGEVDEVTLTVDIVGLSLGRYTCNLIVSDDAASNSPITIQVTLSVHAQGQLRVPSEFLTIQNAIDVAKDSDTVIVADGTYTGPGNRDIDFLGKAITVRSENGPENCIIDCGYRRGKRYDWYYGRGFYFHSGEDANSVLDGFTITNGRAEKGGAIYCEDSSPVITNCIINSNSAEQGGGVYCESSSPTISNCAFIRNTAVGEYAYGGGMYNSNRDGGSSTLTNCTFSRNSAVGEFSSSGGGMRNYNHEGGSSILTNCTFSGNSARFGGGMYNYNRDGGSSTLTNCTFSGNSAEKSGGGMRNSNRDGGSSTLTNCTFSGNSAVGERAYGGGMRNTNHEGGSSILTNCTFSGNLAERGGGISNSNYEGGSSILTNCTFSGNSAVGERAYGGGMYNYNRDGCSSALTNCTFSGNSAVQGGGMYSYNRYASGSSTLTNCTFSENFAHDGNALACSSYRRLYPGTVDVNNCILWDGGNEIWNDDGSDIRITYSDVQGGQTGIYDPCESVIWGAGNIDAAPCFVEPGYWADVNDPNIIVEPNDPNAVWVEGDYHLLEASPCINAGDPNFVAGPNETDIDGQPRVWDGRVDMGADEFVPMIEALMKFTPQALNPKSKGNWVKAHFVLPEGFLVEDVDVNRPAWIEPLGIESDYMNVFINEDGLVEIEAGFARAAFCAAGPIDGTVTVIGAFGSGQYFYGTDTIKIITNNLKYLGVLASHWLEQDCGKPAWCDGLDVDQDSVVNFVDFAMFDGCCIEIITE